MKKLKKMWQNACNRMYICPLRCHIFFKIPSHRILSDRTEKNSVQKV